MKGGKVNKQSNMRDVMPAPDTIALKPDVCQLCHYAHVETYDDPCRKCVHVRRHSLFTRRHTVENEAKQKYDNIYYGAWEQRETIEGNQDNENHNT